jgi:biotin carboxyl carrier protein
MRNAVKAARDGIVEDVMVTAGQGSIVTTDQPLLKFW